MRSSALDIIAQQHFDSVVRRHAESEAHAIDCFVIAQIKARGIKATDIKNYTLVSQKSEDMFTTRYFLKHKNANWKNYNHTQGKQGDKQ